MDVTLTTLMQYVSTETILSFVIIALANLAIVTAFKQAAVRLHEGGVGLLDNPWVQAAMELSQPVLGGVMGAIPSTFPDQTPGVGVLLGIVAGFCSPVVYSQVLKRLAPDYVLSSDGTTRNGAGESADSDATDPGVPPGDSDGPP